MSFIKSILDFLAVPSNFLLLLALAGLLLLCLHRLQSARICVGLSVAGFMFFGYTSAGELLIAPLVSRFPPHDPTAGDPPYGLILLNAGVNEVHATRMGTLAEFDDGAEVVVAGALLAERFPDARVIVGGGTSIEAPLRAADGVRRILAAFGVDQRRIEIDGQAESTAMAVGTILEFMGPDRDKVWWLLTPAHRMPRVMGTFRRAGVEPVPFPVDYRWVPPVEPTHVYAFHNGMELTDDAVHEWLGLLVYRLTGLTNAFFPGPRSERLFE